jgi:hypothetical protein
MRALILTLSVCAACFDPGLGDAPFRCGSAGQEPRSPGGYAGVEGMCRRGATPGLDARTVDARPTDELDVLFVIDSSLGMTEEQAALRAAFPGFIDALGAPRPSLHVGIVSTDMGTGYTDPFSCTPRGDDGLLRRRLSGGCPAPRDGARFIEDVPLPAGGRRANYDGSMGEVFACLAALWDTGCGMEQPLEAMRAALDGSRPENDGFRRPGAALAVVILTDEDDCSARDTGVFDFHQDAIDAELGYYRSFRCTEFGVRCDGRVLPRAAGSYERCEPRGDSYLHAPSTFVDFLRALVPDPARLVVAVIAGPRAPFSVSRGALNEPILDGACVTAATNGRPAVRLEAFASAFGARGHVSSICHPAYGPALGELAATLRSALGREKVGL